jgi:hypothetical protein
MIRAIVTRADNFPIPAVIEQKIGELSEEHTKLLAFEHMKELDNAIDASRERAEKPIGNHLKDQILVEKINGGYGVGNIETLNQKAPWWIWINFGRALSGRTIPPGTDENPRITGHFEPGTKGVFTRGQPKFPINPRKPITAHNYIEKALGIMVGKIRELLK